MDAWGLSKKFVMIGAFVAAGIVGGNSAKDASIAVAWIWASGIACGLYALGQALVDAASAKKP